MGGTAKPAHRSSSSAAQPSACLKQACKPLRRFVVAPEEAPKALVAACAARITRLRRAAKTLTKAAGIGEGVGRGCQSRPARQCLFFSLLSSRGLSRFLHPCTSVSVWQQPEVAKSPGGNLLRFVNIIGLRSFGMPGRPNGLQAPSGLDVHCHVRNNPMAILASAGVQLSLSRVCQL